MVFILKCTNHSLIAFIVIVASKEPILICLIVGTAVWCLTSSSANAVEYHIDYAELYRQERNIIVPPLYAGTCHISPMADGDMIGGDLMVNTKGLDHYKQFGYKGDNASIFCQKNLLM